MFTFDVPEEGSQDEINREKVNGFITNHFSLDDNSLKYFKKEIFTPTVPDEIAELLETKNDLRVSKRIEDRFSLETEDEGWSLFRSYFRQFLYNQIFNYRNFREGKVLVNKNYIKIRKVLIEYYTDPCYFRYMDYDFSLRIDDTDEYTEEEKNKIIAHIDKRLNKVGANTIPKKKTIKITISVNFADWFLCSTKEKWSSCLSLDSRYDYGYWIGLPGLIGDKNRVMLYISNDGEKDYNGIKVDKFVSRTWGILTENGKINLINWYPHKMINSEVINEAFDTDIFMEEGEGFDWITKYPINSLYDLNGNSRFIYQDFSTFKFVGKDLHIIDKGDSSFSFHYHNESELRFNDPYRIERSLSDLIQYKSTILLEVTEKDINLTCDECGDEIFDEEEITFDGVILCSGCFDNLVICTEDSGDIWKNDATYIDSMGDWFSNNYIRENFVRSIHDNHFYEKEECYEFINILGRHKFILVEDAENKVAYVELHDGIWTWKDNAVFDKDEKVYYSKNEWEKIHKDQLELIA